MTTPPDPGPGDPRLPRSSERVHIAAEVTMRRPGQCNYRVRIFDVSPRGCKAEFVERPHLDEHVWVKFEGIEALEASVRWVDGFEGGLEFEKAIHPAVFALLVARLAR